MHRGYVQPWFGLLAIRPLIITGLTFKKQQNYEDALECFLKLHTILRHNAEVLYQIANLYELLDDVSQV
jgi:hypothetical protein